MGLFTTVKNMFKSKNGDAPVITRYGPYEARLGGRVEVDNSVFIINDQYTIVEDPGFSHTLTHAGTTDFSGIPVTRYYLDGTANESECILQVLGSAKVDEVILYRKVDEIYPQTEDDWAGVFASIESDHFTFNEVTYGEAFTSPVTHHETVNPIDGTGEEVYTYKCMTKLFSRVISEDTQPELIEFLMVSVEDDERVALYAGIQLLPAAVTIL